MSTRVYKMIQFSYRNFSISNYFQYYQSIRNNTHLKTLTYWHYITISLQLLY